MIINNQKNNLRYRIKNKINLAKIQKINHRNNLKLRKKIKRRQIKIKSHKLAMMIKNH